MTPGRLYIDIETYSPIDLKKCGVYKYAESQDFDILLFGYAYDGKPAQVIDLTKGALPDGLLWDLSDPAITKLAYNAAFERVCISAWIDKKARKNGKPLHADDWECLAVMAAELGLPHSLEQAGEALGLPEDAQKLKTGKSLIKQFCRPHKKGEDPEALSLFDGSGRCYPQDDPARWQAFIEYCRMDVESERGLHRRLAEFDTSGGFRRRAYFGTARFERQIWLADQAINDRGVAVDMGLVEKAASMSVEVKDKLTNAAKELTGIKNPKSPAQIKAWINKKTGLRVDSLDKSAVSELRSAIEDNEVAEMLDIRANLSKSSLEKYNVIMRTVCGDGRIRGLTQFYGANRSGRWAGRLVQLQNLPGGAMKDLPTARYLVACGHLEGIELLYGDAPVVLSQVLRTAFVPAPGKLFAVADFSAIEARVLAWLADEPWRLGVFRGHGKIYEASAERMFRLPAGSVKKGGPERQKGKVAELALGYGGGPGALIKMGALEMGLDRAELSGLVNTWRDANRNIMRFWDALHKAALAVIKGQLLAETDPASGIRFYKDGPFMRVRLPSGRSISYAKPFIRDGRIWYEGVDTKTNRWGEIETYGAKLAENVVQAVARDCLAEAMLKIEADGLPIVFHVHDEVICEVEEKHADLSLKRMLSRMSEPLEWASGLPLKADGFISPYYKKG